MTLLKQIVLAFSGCSFGLLSSAGVFTVLASVGLIPRFAGKMHVADQALALEEAVILGTIIGGLASVFSDYGKIGSYVLTNQLFGAQTVEIWKGIGFSFLIIFGFFSGIFIGCLAFAIAEMLDSIPIFARRIGFHHGLSVAVTAAAFGKLFGSLFYFAKGIFLSGG
ncbi:MAG: stage V sporulation protein AB [Suilimivivens sp.]